MSGHIIKLVKSNDDWFTVRSPKPLGAQRSGFAGNPPVNPGIVGKRCAVTVTSLAFLNLINKEIFP